MDNAEILPLRSDALVCDGGTCARDVKAGGQIKADVCIVGGGYTGLTTALELARSGVKVVLLEAQEIGFGGSGRNAGHCTPTFTHYSLPRTA